MYNKSVSKISFPGYCTQNTRLNQNTYKSNQVTNKKNHGGNNMCNIFLYSQTLTNKSLTFTWHNSCSYEKTSQISLASLLPKLTRTDGSSAACL